MSKRQKIDRVLRELGQSINEFRKSRTCCAEDYSIFTLDLRNGLSSPKDKTPTVELWAREASCLFENQALTIEDGLRDVLIKIFEGISRNLGHPPRHEGFNLSAIPVEAFGELMQELAEIGAVMSKSKTKAEVGRFKGPNICLEIDTIDGPRTELYFGSIKEKYASFHGYDAVLFESRAENILDALEKTITKAHEHLENG